MEAAQAISLVTDWIRSRGLDYPTEGLSADRFDSGWSVYAPVEVDESDPMAFLDIPVGRSTFLVGDSGRIEEVSSSIPPQQARDQFNAAERAAARPPVSRTMPPSWRSSRSSSTQRPGTAQPRSPISPSSIQRRRSRVQAPVLPRG